jgi:hypothetical protein
VESGTRFCFTLPVIDEDPVVGDAPVTDDDKDADG